MIAALAPAKLNLLLKVLHKRDDNYHELLTLYQLLAWGDVLELETQAAKTAAFTIEAHGPFAAEIPQGRDIEANLLWRAWKLMKDEISPPSAKLKLKLQKNIPSARGLGGGSSDAACLLKILRLLWKPSLPLRDLAAMAKTLGADLPLFVHGFSSWAGGIGEELDQDRQTNPDIYYLLFCPPTRLGTAEQFASLTKKPNRGEGKSKEAEIEQIKKHKLACADGRFWLELEEANDFLAPTLNQHPELAKLHHQLSELTPAKLGGKLFLSGTGSTMFAAYDSRQQAEQDKQKVVAAIADAYDLPAGGLKQPDTAEQDDKGKNGLALTITPGGCSAAY